jgi:hypothetical protein
MIRHVFSFVWHYFMQFRSETAVEGKANNLQAQLLKQSKEVEELESMEQQAFKLELKSEREALEEQFNARNNRLQCDQDNKLKALLARHARELLDHSTETEEKIREAKDEASKVKNDQQRCQKQREAELELKFQERRQQLKNKEEEADAEVARMALEAIKKQVALSTALGAAHLVSSLPPAEITLKSKANAPLSKLVVSQNTPRQISPIGFANKFPSGCRHWHGS